MKELLLFTGFGAYETTWLVVALVPLVLGIYIATCRQLLIVYSRKRLLDISPDARRNEIEAYLDRDDDYTASLRTVDLLLRLTLVLSLAFGRLILIPGSAPDEGFSSLALEFLVLAVELVLVFVVFLEILPGIIARMRPEDRLLRRLPVIDSIHRALYPLRRITVGLTRGCVRLLGGAAERPSVDILEEEILSAAEEGEREGLLKSREIDMIESIITFGDVEVTEAMTPRTEMVCLDVDEPLESNLQKAIDCGHSRIPVYRSSKDNIIGLLYVKDLLRYWDRKEELSLESACRRPHFVPVTKKIGELFQEFKSQRFHIAIILDECGGTSGLITIEDIIEEIVGEITDEFEKIDKPAIKIVSPNVVDVDAALHIDDVNHELETDIPESESYDTVGGFVVSQLGRIPSVGDGFEYEAMTFEVSAADERRVQRLRIRLPEQAKDA